MPEVTGRIRKSKVLTLSIDEIIFGMSKNRLATIPGGNIKIMISGSSNALVPFVSSLSILDRTRISVIKPRLFSMTMVWPFDSFREYLVKISNSTIDATSTSIRILAT